jgi:large repetitive protein
MIMKRSISSVKCCLLSLFLILAFNSNAQPVISSFSPRLGQVGTQVIINGSGFNPVAANNVVYFGAVKAQVTAADDVSLTVIAPPGATHEPISVTNNFLTAYSRSPFIITLPQPGVFTPESFMQRYDSRIPASGSTINAVDLDLDGKSDIINFEQGGTIFKVSRNQSSQGNISFADPQQYSSTFNVSEVVVADLDGDGFKDIIANNRGDAVVSYFRNTSSNGNITFASRLNIPLPGTSWGIAVGDIDQDGKPDLIASIYNLNKVAILKNTTTAGNVSFASAVQFNTGTNPARIACADLNNDGKNDVAILCLIQGQDHVATYRNTTIGGAISFSDYTSYPTPGYPSSLSTGDLDSDDDIDLAVVTNHNNTLYVFQNTSLPAQSITLAHQLTIPTSNWAVSVNISDLNGDSKPDIAFTHSNLSMLSVCRNTSDNFNLSFDTRVNYAGKLNPVNLIAADLDNDGRSELTTANTNCFSAHINKSNEPYIADFNPSNGLPGTTITITGLNFKNVTSVNVGGVPAASFQVISDNQVTATVGSGSTGNISITNLHGSYTRSGFTLGEAAVPPVIASVSPWSGAINSQVTISGNNFSPAANGNIVKFGAVKANVTSASPNNVTVTVPPGSSFEELTLSKEGLTAYSALPFNVTFAGGSSFYPSSFSSPFQPISNVPIQFNSFAFNDLDDDGKTDYAGGYQNHILIGKNTSASGTISFITSQLQVKTGIADVLTHDLNGDGKAELITTNNNHNLISIFENKSDVNNLQFSQPSDYWVGRNLKCAAIRDMDGDGRPDIILIDAVELQRLKIFKNISTSTTIGFASPFLLPYFNTVLNSTTAEINGDGKPDLIVLHHNTTTAAYLSVYKNISTPGNFDFTLVANYAVSGSPRFVDAADIDKDGKMDIVTAGYGTPSSTSVLSIFRNTTDQNTGVIAFANGIHSPLPANRYITGLALGDIDGDNKPDIALSHQYSTRTVGLFRNVSTPGLINLETPFDISVSADYQQVALIDLDADGKLELTTSNQTFKNQMVGAPLPIRLVSLTASKYTGNSVKVNWQTSNEINTDKFFAEHSIDGINFTSIGVITALNSIAGNKYSIIHSTPSHGFNYYRLKIVDRDTRIEYSYVVRANLDAKTPRLNVYPTIASGYVIAEHPTSTNATIHLTDANGRIIKLIVVEKDVLQTRIELVGLSSGTYFITWNAAGIKYTESILVKK